jgi:hypothetical protein
MGYRHDAACAIDARHADRAAARSGSAKRDRAQTIIAAGRDSAWREGKPGGCPAPAV